MGTYSYRITIKTICAIYGGIVGLKRGKYNKFHVYN
jgi:hypothetical protein